MSKLISTREPIRSLRVQAGLDWENDILSKVGWI